MIVNSGIIVIMLSSSVVDRGLEFLLGQTKDDKIGFCCFFFAKHASLRGKNKDWLVRNQDNVSE
jgi:hypothetical protein